VLIGSRAALIRGPSGSGKSRLAWALIDAAASGLIRFARLVADDRVELTASHGRLLIRAPAALTGLIEVRGPDSERIPAPSAQIAEISGIRLPRLPVATGADALAAVLATLNSQPT
jgi:HPr kinase/phosphorylase